MGTFLGVIIALLVAFAVANDADRRGMSSFGWGVGVFLCMIIFLPIYLIVRKPII